jgi:anaerobic C4-dicarboxylate transporter
MWCGIAAIVFVTFMLLEHSYEISDLVGWMITIFLIALVTIGLIITLKGKKQKGD